MDSVSLATGGLFFSWLVHDLEELATMPGWTHLAMDRIPSYPRTFGATVFLASRSIWGSVPWVFSWRPPRSRATAYGK